MKLWIYFALRVTVAMKTKSSGLCFLLADWEKTIGRGRKTKLEERKKTSKYQQLMVD